MLVARKNNLIYPYRLLTKDKDKKCVSDILCGMTKVSMNLRHCLCQNHAVCILDARLYAALFMPTHDILDLHHPYDLCVQVSFTYQEGNTCDYINGRRSLLW